MENSSIVTYIPYSEDDKQLKKVIALTLKKRYTDRKSCQQREHILGKDARPLAGRLFQCE